MNYLWRGPLAARNDALLIPGNQYEFAPDEPLLAAYLELGYLVPTPETTPKKGGK